MRLKEFEEPCGCTYNEKGWVRFCEKHGTLTRELHQRALREYAEARARRASSEQQQ